MLKAKRIPADNYSWKVLLCALLRPRRERLLPLGFMCRNNQFFRERMELNLMDEESHSWFYSTPLAALLLCGAAAIFLLGYLPEAEKARECEERVRAAQSRINELHRQEVQTKRRIAELQAGVPEAIEEAVREVLRLGAVSDFLPREGITGRYAGTR